MSRVCDMRKIIKLENRVLAIDLRVLWLRDSVWESITKQLANNMILSSRSVES